jgi:hypothetical protein
MMLRRRRLLLRGHSHRGGAFLHGVGPRVEESGVGLMPGYGVSTPCEDVELKVE